MFRKLAFAVVMASIAAWASSGAALAGSLADKDVLTVGTEGTYPPYEYYDESNTLTGFDMELIVKVGEKLGKEVKIVDMAFDGLIPALLTNKIDVIAAALNSTEERKQRVDFSDVYDIADSAIVVKSDNDSIKSLEDLEGKIVGVQLGTTEDIFLGRQDIKYEIKRYQKTDDAIREVILGRNDGVLIGTFVGNSYIDSDRFKGALKTAFRVEVNKQDEGFSLAIRKGDPQFLEALNSALRELADSGEIQALKKKYRMD
ncbi:MAG: transporter substrate-binding domain-containing protein [Synergistaceae bacterium]|jgi:polar amino acid transport system substrate-binding protein|nr:transporter substrate-binding domain-containing protein [Synergistaceae bacterium]